MYMNDFSIHSATIKNFAQLQKIEKLCYSQPWTETMLRAELESAHALHFLGLEAGNLVTGFILSQLIADEIHIHNIAVLPDHRKKGIARIMLHHLLTTAKEKGAVKALLEVRSSNRSAVTLYSKNGFKTEGLRRNYYRDGEDALLMTKFLE